LAKLFSELGFKEGVEVGTEAGRYAETICKANPGIKLTCVDPWIFYDDGKGYRPDVTQEQINNFYQETSQRLSSYNVTLLRSFSVDASKSFKDDSLDFVYIDGNHSLEYVISDIQSWLPKIKKGGIISGHDYKKFNKQCYSHVVEAVTAFTESYRIKPWFVLGRKEKLDGELRDNARSWFWIKS